jgi:hypothetical protein
MHYTSSFGRSARIWNIIDMGRALPHRFYICLYLKGKKVRECEIQFTTLEYVEEKAALWVRDGSRF